MSMFRNVAKAISQTLSPSVAGEADVIAKTSIGSDVRLATEGGKAEAIDTAVDYDLPPVMKTQNFNAKVDAVAVTDYDLNVESQRLYTKMQDYNAQMTDILGNTFQLTEGQKRMVSDLFEERAVASANVSALKESGDKDSFEFIEALDTYRRINSEAYGTLKNILTDEITAKAKRAYTESVLNTKSDFVSPETHTQIVGGYQKAFDNIKQKGIDSYNQKLAKLEEKSLEPEVFEKKKLKLDNELQKNLIKTELSLKEKAAVEMHHAIVQGKLKFAGMVSDANNKNIREIVTDYTKTFKHKLSDVYVKMKLQGVNSAAENIKQLRRLSEIAPQIDRWMPKVFRSASKALQQREGSVQNAIRSYMTMLDERNLKDIDLGGRLIQLDADTLARVENAYGVKLSGDDIMLANKISNLFEKQSKMHREFKANNFDTMMREQSIDDFDGARHSGNTYFHAEATDDFKKLIQEKRTPLFDMINAYEAGDRSTGTKIFKSIKENSKLQAQDEVLGGFLKDQNRLSPAEELDRYANKGASAITRYNEKRLIEEAEANFLVKDSLKFKDAQIKNPYKESFKDLKELIEAENAKRRELGAVESTVTALTDITTSAMIATFKQFSLNLLDPFVVSSQFKGLTEVLSSFLTVGAKGIAKGLGKGLLATIKRERVDIGGLWKDTFKNTQYESYAKRYYNEHPNFGQIELEVFERMDMKPLDKKLQRGVDFARSVFTSGFQVSDAVARITAFKAAASVGDKAYDEFAKVLAKRGQHEAIDTLMKKAHLMEFDAVIVEDLVNSALKGRDEFVYQYSRHSLNQEIFDVGKYNRPDIIAKLNAKGGYFSSILRFSSYPMHYYNNSAKAMIRAYKAGDKTPLLRFAATNVMFMMAGNYMLQSEDKRVASVGSFFREHLPLFDSGMGMFMLPYRTMGGMALTVPSEMVHAGAHFADVIHNAVQYGFGNADTPPHVHAGKTLSHIIFGTKQKVSYSLGKSMDYFLKNVETTRGFKKLNNVAQTNSLFLQNLGVIDDDWRDMLSQLESLD